MAYLVRSYANFSGLITANYEGETIGKALEYITNRGALILAIPENSDSYLLGEIEALWRLWWLECYGTEYIPGPPPYGSIFLDYLKPIQNATSAVLSEVLGVLQDRNSINAEIGGVNNFITFGYYFFEFVGGGMNVTEAKEKAISEIRKDPVLFPGYTTADGQNGGTPRPDNGNNISNNGVWIIAFAIVATLVLLK